MAIVISVVQQLSKSHFAVAALLPIVVLLAHLIPYFYDSKKIRSYPGPLLAKISDAWLGWVASKGHRSEVVHELHKKHGHFVRIAPNHISISDPAALQKVYAHGNGALKSDFYDTFVSISRGLFNSRDRAEHTRKRKIISHTFSLKSVVEFEPHVREYVGMLLGQWDRLYDNAKKGLIGGEGEGWRGDGDRLWLDCLPWYNYLAFDIIGDLAFGSPFGMLRAAKDTAPVPRIVGDTALGTLNSKSSEEIEISAVQILDDRGKFSASMGVLPAWWRPIAKKIPWYSKGSKAVQNLAGMAIVMVEKRLATPTDRNDLLSKLKAGKDDQGNPMSKEELTAEALTQLIAGSDTTSNSSAALTFNLALNPRVQARLQAELDDKLGCNDNPVPTWDEVKRLPYLDAVINEGLRLQSTSSLGLPRIVPEGGMTVLGRHFTEGTTLSVPSYTIHRDTKVWGEDVEEFRPERWFERDHALIQKTFNPFSFGPRACVGRNLANMELLIIIASVLRRYDIVLEEKDKPMETCEGFLRKPISCKIGLKRREL